MENYLYRLLQEEKFTELAQILGKHFEVEVEIDPVALANACRANPITRPGDVAKWPEREWWSWFKNRLKEMGYFSKVGGQDEELRPKWSGDAGLTKLPLSDRKGHRRTFSFRFWH